jgi:bzd-type benzoyl-CoA reductase N subunit
VDDPGGYARKWKKENKKNVIGYFCSYTPEEVILASGALPFRIFGSGGNVSLADAHLQAYSCSLVRGALEDALAGNLEFLKGTVFPHTCDSIQRLSDIWRLNVEHDFHLDVVLPVKLNTENSKRYMHNVLKKFKKEFEIALGKEISTEKLKSAVSTINGIRSRLKQLYDIRRQKPGLIGGRDIHILIKGSMVMDRDDTLQQLTQLVDILSSMDEIDFQDGKRIMLAGGLCNMPDIYRIIEESGGRVLWDDFCTGTRYFEGLVENNEDVLISIADRYLQRVVCPAKHLDLLSRGDRLVKRAKELNIQGVIFLYLKFCDPHAFDYPYMKEMLDKEGIPNLLFEIEDQLSSEGQFKTRCEAFIEML